MNVKGLASSGVHKERGHDNRRDLFSFRDPFGARTQDPNIKSVVLYQLS